MSKKSKKDGNNGELDPEDKAIWRVVVKDVTPLETQILEVFDDKPKKPPLRLSADKPSKGADMTAPSFHPIKSHSEQLPQLDFRTEERLKKGKIPIEARLDLHGHNQINAHNSLKNFIIRSSKSGFRCVLVITGKGSKRSTQIEEDWNSPQVGIIKKMFPLWLKDPSIAPLILKTHVATQKDGGQGAYYIYLKRIRDY